MGEIKVALCILSIYRSICGGFYTDGWISLLEKTPHILKSEPNQISHLTEGQS